MLKSALQSSEATAGATVTWFECVLEAGSQSPSCETLAGKIVNLRAIWIVDLILSSLGILTFIVETSRRQVFLARTILMVDSGGLAGAIISRRGICLCQTFFAFAGCYHQSRYRMSSPPLLRTNLHE